MKLLNIYITIAPVPRDQESHYLSRRSDFAIRLSQLSDVQY